VEAVSQLHMKPHGSTMTSSVNFTNIALHPHFLRNT
jgi:hypothetical protein